MDTANPDKPQLTILKRNITGDNLEPVVLASQFDFSPYVWDNCAIGTFGEFIVIAGKTYNADYNDRLFLYNVRTKTVDILAYPVKTIAQNGGVLYIGDSITDNIYEILSGFDDDNMTIEGYWISNDEKFGTENLKKVRKLRVKGIIMPDQILEVYVEYDGEGFNLIGTIRGDGTYVDYGDTYAIGTTGVGLSVLGGEISPESGNFYLAEFKINQTKFRKRTL